MTKLSILMPAYNAAEFINEAVDSLLNQSFKDFELWIINDASTDSTEAIVAGYNDHRIKYFKNDLNRGRDFIVNHFVLHIETEYFTITDADDVSHPSRLQRQIELLDSDADLMMCGTSYFTMDDHGFLRRQISLLSTYDHILKNMHLHAQFLAGTTVMRSKLINHFNPLYRIGFFEAFADADLCSRIASMGKAVNIKEPLYFYRIVSESMSRKNISPFGLNYYKLIYRLFTQRMQFLHDDLDDKEFAKVELYKSEVTRVYDGARFHRHLAYNQLYWGLLKPAIRNAWRSVVLAPWRIKNVLSLMHIILRSSALSLNRLINKENYRQIV